MYISKTLAHLMGGQIFVFSEINKGSVFTLVVPLVHDSSSSPVTQVTNNNNNNNNLLSPIPLIPSPISPQIQTQVPHLTPLTIPHSPNSTPPLTPSANKPALTSNNKNILIVEDNPVNQRVLYRYIHKNNNSLIQNQCLMNMFRHLAAAGYIVTLANNGQEGVDKFFSGFASFDLIFMDIEMPIMNGIEATKTIRYVDYFFFFLFIRLIIVICVLFYLVLLLII